ncbi:MAG: Organic solvent tolerance protein [Pseudomonadota bacterium]|jgi:LPS-assembly protein
MCLAAHRLTPPCAIAAPAFIGLVLLVGWAALPRPAGASALALKLDPQLSEKRPVGSLLPVYGRAQQVEGNTGRETRLIGEAELRRGGTVIRADRLRYDHAGDELLAQGHVRVARDGNLFTGPELRLRIDANEGSFISPSYYLALDGGGRGRAERIDFLGPGRTLLRAATYTTCGPEAPDWELRSASLLIDQDRAEGAARSAVLSFRDVPVLATPLLTFPLGDERRSGFLTPSLSITSRSGGEVVTPWYWNISHDQDLTLYPSVSVRRGLRLGGEYRYLSRSYSGESRFETNPDDALTGESRYFWQSRHGFSDFMGWSGGWDVRGVSDDNYFVDYSSNITTSADRVLPRMFSSSRTLSEQWSVNVAIQKYQAILDARPGPYEREPQLQLNFVDRAIGPFALTSQFEATRFTPPDPVRVGGWRTLAHPQLSLPFRHAGWFAIPKLAVHASRYELDAPTSGESELSRVLPTLSFDTGLTFERDIRFGDAAFIQTLEPRLFYVKTPYKDQSRLPVFDTAVADFNFSQLFAENTFVGQDRIADVNQLTAAAISRLIRPVDGAEHIRFATGFRHYFTDQNVAIPGVSARTDRRSDLLAAASGGLGRFGQFDAGLQYSLATSRIPRVSLAWRHQPDRERLLNVALRYRREQLGQADVSLRWPVSGGWNALGRLNYSFLGSGVDPISGLPNTRGPVEVLGGFEYLASCWGARVVAQRFRTSFSESNTALFLQFELTGVGRIGQNPLTILQRNIPGYRTPQGPETPTSRYFGYE